MYKCEINSCDTHCAIRTKVKNIESEYYGLKVCSKHAREFNTKKISDKTRRTQEARREQRNDYPEFYQKHIEIALTKMCEECCGKLEGNSSNIAHIISKSNNPETATNDNNVIYLCQNCHSMYDRSLRIREQMNVMQISLERFRLLPVENITSEVIFFQDKL